MSDLLIYFRAVLGLHSLTHSLTHVHFKTAYLLHQFISH
jgi:hypothetical protein